MTLKQLDDKEFTITVENVIDCDHVLRVPGKGMPRRNGKGFGDLYITFEVDFPVQLTKEQKDKIAEILGDKNGRKDDKGGEL
jgi:DnaJ-class molecular chaperone